MAYNWIPKKTHPRRPGHPPAAGKTHNQNRLILLVLLLVLLVLLLLSSPHGNAGSAGNHGACRFASCSKKQLACVEKPRPEKIQKKRRSEEISVAGDENGAKRWLAFRAIARFPCRAFCAFFVA
jgi:hypothetical protein